MAADWATAQDGPACSELLGGAIAADTVYDCCERHLDMCAALCTCGFKGFQCWDNGRGGCASVCQGCKICV